VEKDYALTYLASFPFLTNKRPYLAKMRPIAKMPDLPDLPDLFYLAKLPFN
jgi:hypothetical protein